MYAARGCGRGHNHSQRTTGGVIDCGVGPADAHKPGTHRGRMIRLERDILSKNEVLARDNRARIESAGIFALNLVSSPGSGKTSLLVQAIADFKHRFPISLIQGDPQTSNDADRIRGTGIPAIQINTGSVCCLDADMIGHAARPIAVDPEQCSLH